MEKKRDISIQSRWMIHQFRHPVEVHLHPACQLSGRRKRNRSSVLLLLLHRIRASSIQIERYVTPVSLMVVIHGRNIPEGHRLE